MAKWFRSSKKSIDEVTGEIVITPGKAFQLETNKGTILVPVSKVGELKLTDSKTAPLLDKFVKANEPGVKRVDPKTARISIFYGFDSNREYSDTDSKLSTLTTTTSQGGVQEVTEEDGV